MKYEAKVLKKIIFMDYSLLYYWTELFSFKRYYTNSSAGKMVKEINQNGALNISDIPNGLYFLRSGEQVLKLNKQ
jgi:hypothetical protein